MNDAATAQKTPILPSFSNHLNLGHVLVMVGMAGSIAAGAISIYVAVIGQMNSLGSRLDFQRQEMIESQKQLQRIQEEQKQFTRDLYLQLSKVADQLTQLRVDVAGTSHTHAGQPIAAPNFNPRK